MKEDAKKTIGETKEEQFKKNVIPQSTEIFTTLKTEVQETLAEKLKRFFTTQKEIVRNSEEVMGEEVIREKGRQGNPLKLKISSSQNVIEFPESVIYEEDKATIFIENKKIDQGSLMFTKGMQLLDYETCLEEICKRYNCNKEDAEKEYFLTNEEVEDEMKDKPSKSLKYEKFFQRELSAFGIGCYDIHEKTNRLKERIKREGEVCMRLAKGDMVIFGPNEWQIIRLNGENGILGIGLIPVKST